MRSLFLFALPWIVMGQTTADMQSILQRLDKLEKENQTLKAEVKELRARIGEPETAEVPPVIERVEIAEKKIEESVQTKVEASQKFPIKLTGMALFNLFF